MNKKVTQLVFSISFALGLSSTGAFAATAAFPSLSSLGKSLFSDNNLSLTRTQSCASCHDAEQGFIDIRDNGVAAAVSLGHDGVSLGNRNAPTISYAKFSPNFTGTNANNASGGQFWDGRAGNLSKQAEEPPLSANEMGMLSKADVIARLQENSEYVAAFESYFGNTIFDNVDTAYTAMADSIAAFEESDEVSPFDSKFDRALTGDYTLSSSEAEGMGLFFSPRASCVHCHSTTMGRGQMGTGRGQNRANFQARRGGGGRGAGLNPPRGGGRGADLGLAGMRDGTGSAGTGVANSNHLTNIMARLASSNEVFSNFRYFNNGSPSNNALNIFLQSVGQQNEFLTTGDQGLLNNPLINGNANSRGRFKVPTLRNIAVTAPYMHNGVFKNLNTVLAFYDHQGGNQQRVNNPETGVAWQDAEVPETVTRRRLGMRNSLSDTDINNLECFLRTLTDQKFELHLPTLTDGRSCS